MFLETSITKSLYSLSVTELDAVAIRTHQYANETGLESTRDLNAASILVMYIRSCTEIDVLHQIARDS
jgi:hypothetical protein